MGEGMLQTAAVESEPRPREGSSLRAIAAEMGISGAFIRPAELARLLGVSSGAIRTQARQGLFPIPHRRLGKAILFRMEDVAAWHDRESEAPPRHLSIIGAQQTRSNLATRKGRREPKRPHKRRPLSEADKQRSARIKAEVLAEMAIEKR